MRGLKLGHLGIGGNFISGVEQIITATVEPVAQALFDGDALSTITNYATLTNTANYASTAGTITSAVIQVDGVTQASGAFTVSDGEAVTVLVSDDAGTTPRSWTIDGNVVHVAPTASGALSDQSFAENTGVQTYDASGDFTGSALVYSINSVTGVSINSGTGVISFNTATTGLRSGASIIVTATNSGGSAQSGFSFDITGSLSFSVSNIGEEIYVDTGDAPGSTPVSLTIQSGDYAGTYTTRVTDSATLTVDMIAAAPTPLVLPTLTDGSTEITGTPALWLFDGADPGDPTFEFYLDAAATGETSLTYTIQPADDGSDLTLREVFGGVTVNSSALTIGGYVFTDNNDGTATFTSAGTSPTPTFTDNGDGTATKDT